MLKNRCGYVIKSILLVMVGSILGVLLLALVFCVPVNVENKAESLQLLEDEGWYPATPMHVRSLDTWFHSFLPGVMDDATDTIMIMTAADETEGNPLVRAMNTHSEARGNYSYYWHGYVSILRPLLYFFDYTEIRILNGMLQILLVFLLAYEVSRKKSIHYAVLLLTSYGLLMPFALAVSLQYTWVFYITIFSCLFLVKHTDYLEEKSRYVYFFVVTGMLTSFFDLLTYPLFTWGFPMVWWLLLGRKGVKRMDYLWCCISSGISWIAGYGGMWAAKWLLGTWITGENVLENAINEVFLRVGMKEAERFTLYNRMEAIYFNWKHYEYVIYMLILLVWLVWIGIMSLRKGFSIHKNVPALLLTGASSLVWYWVLANHTKGHHFFTYRIFGISVLAVLGILLQSVCMQPEEETGSVGVVKSKKGIIGIWVAAFLCGAGLTLFAREDVFAINGGAEYTTVALQEGSCVKTDFVPTFSWVSNVGLAMDSESTEGVYEIILYEGDSLLYRENIPLADYEKSNYASVNVDWRLQENKTYTMEIRAVGNNREVSALVTIPTEMPMNEFSNLKIDDGETGGQPIMGVTYRALPTSRKTLFFILCSWAAVCAAGILTGRAIIH